MKLKQREKALIYGGAAVIILWLLYSYVYVPKLDKAKILQQEITLVEQSIQTNREIIQNSKTLEAEIEQLQKELGSLREMMGGKRQMFQLMEQLEKEPYKTNIKLVSILPVSEETELGSPGVTGPSQAIYKKSSLNMKLECQYKAVGQYMEAMEALPMFITIDKFSIERNDEIYPNLAVNLTVSTYSLGSQTVLD